MFGSLDISVSGLVAQRTRLNAIASNIANADAVLDENGNVNPYRARIVHFAPTGGVDAFGNAKPAGVEVESISEDQSEPRLVWDPSHPYAYPDGHPKAGYVPMPNVNTVIEQINALSASRSYEANLAAADASKTMMSAALRLLA
ncbi:MAG: flagellar basal body rod protein FlgC [Phycisphaerales bacterium]